MGYNDEMKPATVVVITIMVVAAIIIGIFGIVWGYNTIRVWSAEQAGKAEYAQAEANRKIAILEAEAKHQAAKALAQAEIERAKGVAEANRIIGASLHDNEAYLRYLWVSALEGGGQMQVVYVPTEAGMPILEAGRLGTRQVERK